jgi:hypothetical protein
MMSAFLLLVYPVLCFAFIKSFPAGFRHAGLVKRQAFFAPGRPTGKSGSQYLNKLSQIVVSAMCRPSHQSYTERNKL